MFKIVRPLTSILLSYALILMVLPRASSAIPLKRKPPASPSNATQQRAASRPGELLVRFRSDVSQQAQDVLLATHGARRQRALRGESRVEKVELPAGQDSVTTAAQMKLNPQVEFAEANFLIEKADLTPNDPNFGDQWALNNTGQNGGQFSSDIDATAAWQITSGSQSTTVAVIDSGIDFTHPDLANNKWTNPTASASGDVNGWDYITNSGNIIDEQGHGTAIAGIIAAQGNNGTGISGAMWQASLMSLRVLDNTGTGDVADAIEAIDYAVSHGAHVINISWGTNGESNILKEAIERAIRRGVIVVCSAGNNGQNVDINPYYPASFNIRNLIVVAASDNFDQLSPWSNWGNDRVTIAAPGTNILTTQMGGGYWQVTGTSASAPLVSGVAGLMKSIRFSANSHHVQKALKDGARLVMSLSGKVNSGGVLSAAGALEALRGSAGQPPQLPPPGYGTGGQGPGGTFSTTPPPTITGAPASNLTNLDQLRNSTPQQPRARQPIESNLVCADCDPQSGGGGSSYYPANDPNFSTARGRAENEAGQPGEDLGSRNFNWSLPLLSLSGRAGMDLGLTLYYNSLVWTKDGSYIKFNADFGSPAPGFRLGLPKLQGSYYDYDSGETSHMLVTPSGRRVELRRTAPGSVIYEAIDGSYTQMDTTNSPYYVVIKTSDGTQMKLEPMSNGEYKCTELKDRNGNRITATYNYTNGHLQTITDTLGRTITFVYDANNNLQAIRQTWAGASHDWATFSYGQVWVNPQFSGLLVNGPNGNYVTVLTQVSLHDGTYYTFNYNDAFGQVYKINHYAADSHLLSYTSYNLNTSTGQTDCPRFTERRDKAENWNSGNEAVTSYIVASDNSWTKVTAPDGTVYKETFETTGWRKGLTNNTKNYLDAAAEAADTDASPTWKKKTTIVWTQTEDSLSYQKNPRVTETKISDSDGNLKRVTISYSPPAYAAYSLPYEVIEYANDGATMLRRTYTDYNLSSTYTDRRIIGLVSAIHVVDHASGAYVSKTTFDYDTGGEYLVATSASPTQHDGTNYGTGFVSGRGNLTEVKRWDVTDIYNSAKAIPVKRTGYNITGLPVFMRDALNHQTSIGYADSFSDGNNSRNTFAYPTTMTDADNFQAFTEYKFETGAVTKTLTPAKGIGGADPIYYLDVRVTYDSAGRLDKITNQNNSAYTRYFYATSGEIGTYSTIASTANTAGEAFSVTYFDGAGRLRAIGTDNPNTTGGYKGQFWTYDVMGRLSWQSNPAEMTGGWVPTAEDSAGWVWTTQTYDWKGRPKVTTMPDGATRENTYGGCGCAGGEVTTVRDERGRRRKLTKDVLGRFKQVDELNWDQSVYATTTYLYNVRDQITNITQAGQTPRTFTYDGYGRLYQKATPEQGTSTYSYFADDSVQMVTDARGATTTFAYNNRHLPTGITYGVPSGVAATANVSFTYDSAGNRTNMSDGLGYVSYAYNSLSQLTSESRYFNGLASYTLSYTYNLGGELTSITNPWGAQVGYDYDLTGRPKVVSGVGYAGDVDYINNITYRAFGLKDVSYTNGDTLQHTYDNRMRLTKWHVARTGQNVMRWDYAYDKFNENSDRVTYAKNLDDATLDRSYDYDHVGRMWASHTGKEARWHVGLQQYDGADGPYAYNNTYDQWGNITQRNGWGVANASYTATYSNNKRSGLSYDAAGNFTADGSVTYDATGQQVSFPGGGMTHSYDGDRLRSKKVENGVATYYLRSTVLGGQVVAELSSSGTWNRGYVYLAGQLVAIQYGGVSWVHQDPITKSQRVTNSSGSIVSTVDLDPWGGETGRSSSQAFQPHRFTSYERDADGGDDAMHRRYGSYWSRFSQPDPYDGSYDLTNPQSLNRYTYTQNDPANFVDTNGLSLEGPGSGGWSCSGTWSAMLQPDGTITDFRITSAICITWGGGGEDFRTWDFTPGENLQAMMNLLENTRCSTFISNLINVARQLTGRNPYSYDARELIARISSQPNNSFEGVEFPNGYNLVPGQRGGSAFGDLGSGEASVYIPSSVTSNGGRDFAQVHLALIGLHETIHLAGGARSVRDGSAGYYSDQVLAEAASILTRAPGFPQSGSENAAYSVYWDNQLREHCSPWSSNR